MYVYVCTKHNTQKKRIVSHVLCEKNTSFLFPLLCDSVFLSAIQHRQQSCSVRTRALRSFPFCFVTSRLRTESLHLTTIHFILFHLFTDYLISLFLLNLQTHAACDVSMCWIAYEYNVQLSNSYFLNMSFELFVVLKYCEIKLVIIDKLYLQILQIILRSFSISNLVNFI